MLNENTDDPQQTHDNGKVRFLTQTPSLAGHRGCYPRAVLHTGGEQLDDDGTDRLLQDETELWVLKTEG